MTYINSYATEKIVFLYIYIKNYYESIIKDSRKTCQISDPDYHFYALNPLSLEKL